MLALLRRKAQSPSLQLTIVIIILVFVFWGVGANQGTVQNAVATVNGESISFQDYQKEYDQIVSGLRDQLGGVIPNNLLETLNIKQQVLNNLIQSTLLRQGAMAGNLYVSNKELRDTIQSMEAFQNNGSFDVQWYKDILTGSRLTVSKFEEGMRYDLLSAKAMNHLSRFGKISIAELQDLFEYKYGQVKLEYSSFDAANYKDMVETTDEAISAFFEENKTDYQSDPKVKIKYLLFPEGSDQAAPIDDQEILTYYQNNLTQFSRPEQRKASHILIRTNDTDTAEQKEASRKEIEDILAKVQSGEDFGELAKQFSKDGSASRGGDLGYFGRGQMVKPFEDAVFSMTEGDTSGVIETQFGLHIIKLDKIQVAAVSPLEAVKSTIVEKLTKASSKNNSFKNANDAYEKIILSGSLAKYAESSEVTAPLIETDFFIQQNPPVELQTMPQLINTAFSLNKGELSSIIEVDKGYAIIYIDDIQPPAQQELQDVKELVTKTFVAKKSLELAKAAAEEMLTKIKDGQELSKVAEETGAEHKTTPFISRGDSSSAELPAQLIDKGLALSESKPLVEEIIPFGESFYIISFKENMAPDDTIFEEKKAELETQLTQRKSNDLLSAWVEHLQKDAKITTNEQLL